MDDGVRGRDLERLRERLYRPDPPPGSADAYRSALAEAHPPAPAVPAPRAWRIPPFVAPVALAIAGVVALAGVVGRPAASVPATTPTAASTPGPEFAAGLAPPQVPGTLIAERTSADPPGAITVDADHRVVTVAVLCQAAGTLDVRLGPRESKTFLCTAAGPALALARSDEALGRFTMTVVAAPDVDWAVSVGAVEDQQSLGFAQ